MNSPEKSNSETCINSIDKLSNDFFEIKSGNKFLTLVDKIKDEKEKKAKFNEYEIEQGDILVDYPDNFIKMNKKPLALIIASYTCDIPKKETRRIHLLPIFLLNKLNPKLLITFILEQASKTAKDKIDIKNPESLKQAFQSFNAKDREKFAKFVKKIFQFKNRNYFLICPHKALGNKWSYADIQSILTIKKEDDTLKNLIKYTKISVSNPWKEKFGSILGSRYGKVAVDHFTEKEIKYLYGTINKSKK